MKKYEIELRNIQITRDGQKSDAVTGVYMREWINGNDKVSVPVCEAKRVSGVAVLGEQTAIARISGWESDGKLVEKEVLEDQLQANVAEWIAPVLDGYELASGVLRDVCVCNGDNVYWFPDGSAVFVSPDNKVSVHER